MWAIHFSSFPPHVKTSVHQHSALKKHVFCPKYGSSLRGKWIRGFLAFFSWLDHPPLPHAVLWQEQIFLQSCFSPLPSPPLSSDLLHRSQAWRRLDCSGTRTGLSLHGRDWPASSGTDQSASYAEGAFLGAQISRELPAQLQGHGPIRVINKAMLLAREQMMGAAATL